MTKASSALPLGKRGAHSAALDNRPRPGTIGYKNNNVKVDQSKSIQQSCNKAKTENNNEHNVNKLAQMMTSIQLENEPPSKVNTEHAEELSGMLENIHLGTDKENLAPEKTNNNTDQVEIEPNPDETSTSDEDKLCSRSPGRHDWKMGQRNNSGPYNMKITSRSHHSGSSLTVSEQNGGDAVFLDPVPPLPSLNITNEELERGPSPPLLVPGVSPNGSISDDEVAVQLGLPGFTEAFARSLSGDFKDTSIPVSVENLNQLSPQTSELSTSPVGSPYSWPQGSPQQVVPQWRYNSSDSSNCSSSPSRVSPTPSPYTTPSLSPGSPSDPKLDELCLDEELPSSPPPHLDMEPPLGLEDITYNYSINQCINNSSIMPEPINSQSQYDNLFEDLSEIQNVTYNTNGGLQNVPVIPTIVSNTTEFQNIGIQNMALLNNMGTNTNENQIVPLSSTLINTSPDYSNNLNNSITYIIVPYNDSMMAVPPAKSAIRPRPIQPLPETAKEQLLKRLDRQKKRVAWVRVAMLSDTALVTGEAKDGDTQMMILVGQQRDTLLELVYAMVERMKRIPGALEAVNKREQSALYVASLSLPSEPIVACYIAETLSNLGVDIRNPSYEGGKSLLQCVRERGESHINVLTELMKLKDSTGKLIFSN